MIWLTVAIIFTISVSALCSVLEAMVLSTTTAETEALKKSHPKRGLLLEKSRFEIEETSSAILSLNTVANTLGATLCGGLATQIFGEEKLIYFSIGLTIGILIFAEIIPKNIGVLYRGGLQRALIYPLWTIRQLMRPISLTCKHVLRFIFRKKKNNPVSNDEQEIILLADKSAKEGALTQDERNMILNALSLDDVPVSDILTPRTVVTLLGEGDSVEEVFNKFKIVPFGRIPVYKEDVDNVVGVVRRRDLLTSKANDEDSKLVRELMHKALIIPDSATAADSLKQLLKGHQQLGVVVDEFGSLAGVVTLEDIFEHILGQEIFEQDDVAIDMRELARRKQQEEERNKKNNKRKTP